MNLFRSEEHARNWSKFDPATEDGITPLDDLLSFFHGPIFERRLDPDYVTHFPEYMAEFQKLVAEYAKKHPFWQLPAA